MSVTPLYPAPVTRPRPKDPSGADRQRRYRQNRKRDALLANPLTNNTSTVTRDGVLTVTLSMEDIDKLASRISRGPVTRHERYMASQIILHYLWSMPDDSGGVAIDCPLDDL